MFCLDFLVYSIVNLLLKLLTATHGRTCETRFHLKWSEAIEAKAVWPPKQLHPHTGARTPILTRS
jgi:hypothetical protein